MRTFIAIPLPEKTIENIGHIQNELRSKISSGVAWIAADSIHLTLKFLGEVEESRISEIIRELQKLCKDTPAFSLDCGGLGCFPNIRQPRVLWVGIEPEKQLNILQAQIETVCFTLGFEKEERSFSPHLTIGRIKTGLQENEIEFLQGKIKDQSFQSCSKINVNEIILFKSELTRTGAIYSALCHAGLKQDSR